MSDTATVDRSLIQAQQPMSTITAAYLDNESCAFRFCCCPRTQKAIEGASCQQTTRQLVV